jgi:hypothetical protein
MRHSITWPVAVVFVAMTAVASAQDAGPSPHGTVPGPNATPAGAEANSKSADNPVQPAPGAMRGSDAVPSTLSEKNAADDKLITVAYTFKNLTLEQRRAIYQALNQKGPDIAQAKPAVGIQLPAAVDLAAVPDAVIQQVPQMKGYAYAQAGDKVLLVAPIDRVVVEEITP